MNNLNLYHLRHLMRNKKRELDMINMNLRTVVLTKKSQERIKLKDSKVLDRCRMNKSGKMKLSKEKRHLRDQ